MPLRASRRPAPATPRGFGRLVVVLWVLGVAVLVAAAGCTSDADAGSPTDADARPTVAIVGDSITEQGETELERGLAERWRLLVDGRSGHTVAEQLPAARELADADPVQVVVNLGTNDVLGGDDLVRSSTELAEVAAAFPGAACVHLVTVNEGMRVASAPVAQRASRLNEAMAALAASDPRIRVIDWSAVVAADEAGSQPDGPILSDTVHPTSRGQRVLSGLYAEGLAGCPSGSGGV